MQNCGVGCSKFNKGKAVDAHRVEVDGFIYILRIAHGFESRHLEARSVRLVHLACQAFNAVRVYRVAFRRGLSIQLIFIVTRLAGATDFAKLNFDFFEITAFSKGGQRGGLDFKGFHFYLKIGPVGPNCWL